MTPRTIIVLTIELPRQPWKWAALKRWLKVALRGYGIVVRDYRQLPSTEGKAGQEDAPGG